MLIVKATELQNNFGKYLAKVIEGEELIIMKNGKEVARMTPKEKVNQFLSDQLLGMFPELGDLTKDDERAARVEKYESDD